MITRITVTALTAGLFLTTAASAQEYYLGGTIGYGMQSDSDNSGTTGAFTTGDIGDGSTIPVSAGTPYGWDTEFDGALVLSGEFGARHDSGFRAGVEVVYSQADVDGHSNVTLGGGSIGALDAASIAGSPTPLGVTVAQVVADGRGEITNTAIFLNGYYDFNRDGQVQPYVGVGIGYADVSVNYNPSGVSVIDDSEGAFAYQLKAGATMRLNEQWDVYGEYTYRATEDVDFNNRLFPGSLEIENESNVISIGVRYRFGG